MKDKDTLLSELNDIIIGYLRGDIEWSHFSDTYGTTRAAISNKFFESNGRIYADNIRSHILVNIKGELLKNKDNQAKLERILVAWDEWIYISGFLKMKLFNT